MASLFIRTYTFTDGTTAYGSQVETEIGNIVTILNNLNTAVVNWGQVSTLHTTNVPLIADCSSGSQDIADFKNNSVIKASISSAGLGTFAGVNAGSQKVTAITNGTVSTDAVAFGQYQNTLTNILDNGGFEIWQRGTSFTNPASSIYTADRWVSAYTGGTPTATVTKETSTIDTGLAAFKYVLTATNSATVVVFKNFIENYADYRGKTITFSCRIKSSVANSINIGITDDNGNTASATNVGTNFETLTVTKTISATATTLNVEFGMRSVAAQALTFYADSAILVLGSETIPFVPTNPLIDMARCQRYFYSTFDPGITPAQASGSNLGALTYTIHTAGVKNDTAELRFPVTMRVAPTITTYNPASSNANWYNISQAADSGVPTVIANISTHSIVVRNPQVAGDAVGSLAGIHITATADL